MSGVEKKEESRNPEDTSWIYRLNKGQVLAEILKFGTEAEATESIDALRKKLASLVRTGSEEKKPQARDSANSEETETKVVVKVRKMSTERVRLEFHLGKDDWETYIERLELYFLANDVENNKQTAVLLTKVSADTYSLIRDLCAPVKPKDKTFKELVKLVGDHLCPKPSEAMDRCKFHQATQTASESVAEFAARLKKMSLKCNFAELQNALRDQLVCGVREHDTRVGLFCEKDLTFEKAYEYATTRELARKNASDVTKKGIENSTQRDVNMLKNFRGRKSERGGRARGSGRGARGGQRHQARGTPGPKRDGEGGSSDMETRACYCCGGKNHWASNCRHRNKTCDNCGRKGHLKRTCRRNGENAGEGTSSKQTTSAGQSTLKYLQQPQRPGGTTDEERRGESDNDFFMLRAYRARADSSNVRQVSSMRETDPMYTTVKVGGVNVEMEIDIGTFVTVIGKATKDEIFPNVQLQSTDIVLQTYGSGKLCPVGTIKGIKVEWNNVCRKLDIVVVNENGPPLMGREWLSLFGQWPLKLHENKNRESVKVIDKITIDKLKTELLRTFPKLIENTVGQFNKGTLKLRLKEGAKPVALKARHLPFALKEKVGEEIERLLSFGHIETVGASEWATPIVPGIKPDGKIRIRGNFKLTLNLCLIIDKYPLPLIDEIFAGLQGGELFSQIDLSHAYMQILVDEKSREYLTIVTHKGFFRYRKLPEGVASGPGDFQRKMEDCLRGIPNTSVYLDNIFCTGCHQKEHFETLKAVFTRLEDCNLRVNIAKCDLFKEKLELLGFVIDKQGLHKSESKINAIVNAPEPVNSKQLSSFLGLVTYYARFLPSRASKLKALYDCAKSDVFEWNENCKEAFEWVKSEIASERVLAHYDPKEKLVLACDASAYGLSAILSHEYKDGIERPIAFASKVIPEKEMNRAIIDKEAGAIVFGFRKFYNYVYGRHVTLKTDHKPLVFIFGPRKEIPLTIASRLQRWAYYLSGFTYGICYVRSEANGNCDALSRLPVNDETPVFKIEANAIKYIEEGALMLSFAEVRKQTLKCEILSRVSKWVEEGWPSASASLSDEELKYRAKQAELYLEKGCVMRGNRIVIPVNMRDMVLRELHSSHLGIVKMKSLARSYVWWPGVDVDVEETAKACEVCVELGRKPAKTVLTPWSWPDRPWARVL